MTGCVLHHCYLCFILVSTRTHHIDCSHRYAGFCASMMFVLTLFIGKLQTPESCCYSGLSGKNCIFPIRWHDVSSGRKILFGQKISTVPRQSFFRVRYKSEFFYQTQCAYFLIVPKSIFPPRIILSHLMSFDDTSMRSTNCGKKGVNHSIQVDILHQMVAVKLLRRLLLNGSRVVVTQGSSLTKSSLTASWHGFWKHELPPPIKNMLRTTSNTFSGSQ